MLKIRLTRIGSNKNPHYRVVVVPARSKRNTKAIEILGFYDPKTKEKKLDSERITYWRSKGAQLSDIMTQLMGEKVKKDYSKNKRVVEKRQKEEDAKSKEVKEAKTETVETAATETNLTEKSE